MKPLDTDLKDKLFKACLNHIPFDGWGQQALSTAAKELNITEEAALAYFPNPSKDLLNYHYHCVNDYLLEQLEIVKTQKLRFHEKIIEALMATYQHFSKDRPAIQRAANLMATPAWQGFGLGLIWQQADLIWQSFGDKSLDWNYYSKRGLLSGVLLSTMPIYLQDESEDLSDTRAFLIRRVDNVLQIPKIRQEIEANISKHKERLMKVKPDILNKCKTFSSTQDLRMRGV